MGLFEKAAQKLRPKSDVERLLAALERIGDALELICDKEYGERVTPRKVDMSGEPPEVSYSDDLLTLRQELEEAERGIQPEDDDEQPRIQPSGAGTPSTTP